MEYKVVYLNDAITSLKRMQHGLTGDVTRLKSFVPNYRLRVGDWRVLFEIEEKTIVVHEVKHRSQVYD